MCCTPIPGDDVLGFVNDDEEVVLHKQSCPVAMRLKTSYGPRLVATRWGGTQEVFQAELTVLVDNTDTVESICNALKSIKGVQKAARIS